MTEISLGISPCPNDVYIFSGLLLGFVSTGNLCLRVEFQDVETLNRRAMSGMAEVAKISYAAYPRCASEYDLLECGGALGRGVGPLLLSHGGAWNPDAEVLVPGEFTTANFLLDFYAARPLAKRFMPFDTLYAHLCRTPGAQGVVINEKRFSYRQDELTQIQDLGAYWEEKTGLPIPLGAIIVRKSLGLTDAIDGWIRASLTWADHHREEALSLCRKYAGDLTEGSIESHINLYVNEYTRDLGAEGRQAVNFFLAQQRTGS